MTAIQGPVPAVGMTFSAGAHQPRPASPAAASLGGERLNFGPVVRTNHPPKPTLSEQLRNFGRPTKPRNFIEKAWGWFNKPEIEAGREFASVATHLGPSLLLEQSKNAAAAGTAATGLASKGFVASSGFAFLAKLGPILGSVGGTVQLLRDMVRGRRDYERPVDHTMMVGGGFLVATGSVIAMLGGILPGAIIGGIGTLAHAIGLWRKHKSHQKHATSATYDPDNPS